MFLYEPSLINASQMCYFWTSLLISLSNIERRKKTFWNQYFWSLLGKTPRGNSGWIFIEYLLLYGDIRAEYSGPFGKMKASKPRHLILGHTTLGQKFEGCGWKMKARTFILNEKQIRTWILRDGPRIIIDYELLNPHSFFGSFMSVREIQSKPTNTPDVFTWG